MVKMLLPVIKQTTLSFLSRSSKLLYWFKRYGDFAEWVDFAYWWSCIWKGLPCSQHSRLVFKRHPINDVLICRFISIFCFPLGKKKEGICVNLIICWRTSFIIINIQYKKFCSIYLKWTESILDILSWCRSPYFISMKPKQQHIIFLHGQSKQTTWATLWHVYYTIKGDVIDYSHAWFIFLIHHAQLSFFSFYCS